MDEINNQPWGEPKQIITRVGPKMVKSAVPMRTLTPITLLTDKYIHRFWSHIQKGNYEMDCWSWSGYKVKSYGKIWMHGKSVYAHRISWLLHNGKDIDQQDVLHRCDNPECCNPKHLFLGDTLSNTADRCSKLRQSVGEECNKKLTYKQVLAIRSIYSTRKFSQREIAAEFGVVPQMISQIVRREVWKHL